MSDFRVKILKPNIRDPKTKRRLDVGKTMVVQSNSYWLRRLRDGDCEKVAAAIVEPPKPKKENKKKSSSKVDEQQKSDEVSK